MQVAAAAAVDKAAVVLAAAEVGVPTHSHPETWAVMAAMVDLAAGVAGADKVATADMAEVRSN